jgi:hypothetical protein
MGHECDTGGSFTDTASYTDIIAECTNVSVGYKSAHCSTEHTNVDYLFRLRDALLKLDTSKLVEKRMPGESPSLYRTYTYNSGQGSWWDSAREEGRKAGGLDGIEVRAKCAGMTWMDQYEFDSDTCLWFPKATKEAKAAAEKAAKRKERLDKAGRKTDLGVTKTMNSTIGGSVASSGLNKDGKPNTNTVILDSALANGVQRTPTYAQYLRLIRDNDMVVADLLESLGYGPGELLDHLLDVGASGNTVRM